MSGRVCGTAASVMRRRLPSPHQTHVVLVGGDLLVVRGAGQRPPGRDATAGGLGGAVIT